jgi:hypothetical protein
MRFWWPLTGSAGKVPGFWGGGWFSPAPLQGAVWHESIGTAVSTFFRARFGRLAISVRALMGARQNRSYEK